jgi:hypothetical protein
MKRILSGLGLVILTLAAGVYIAGSAPQDFIGLKNWTKDFGPEAGAALAILFLIGGVYVQLCAFPRNREKAGK